MISINKQLSIVMIAIALSVSVLFSGCGGVGSGDAATSSGGTITLAGSVQTPGGTAVFREAGRAAAQLANITSSVAVNIYTISAAGTTLIASGSTGATGDFSITLPSGINLSDYVVIAQATVGGGTLRSFVTGNTGTVVSPVSEAAVQVVEDRLSAAGKSIEALTIEEISTIKSAVSTASTGLDFSGAESASAAAAIAKNAIERDAGVATAISSGISSTPPARYAVFTTTDYTTGQVSAVALNGSPALGVTVRANVASVNADAVLVSDSDYVYVINRGGNNIQVLDPADGFSTLANYSTGDNSNPHDMEIISSTKAYITLYQKNYILIVNPRTGVELGRIDLSAFADSDGVPDIDQIVRVGTRVFVTVQRLVNYSPSAEGLVVAIDTNTDTVIDADAATAGTQAITLNGYNPQAIEYLASTGKLYVSCAGSYFSEAIAGGIDSVDATAFTVATVMSKTALSGTPGDIKMVSSTQGYVIVSGADWSNSIWAFNPSTGALAGSSAVYTTTGYVPYIGLDPYGYLLISDTNYSAPGVVFVDTTTNTVSTTAPANTGLPPFAMTFVEIPSAE